MTNRIDHKFFCHVPNSGDQNNVAEREFIFEKSILRSVARKKLESQGWKIMSRKEAEKLK